MRFGHMVKLIADLLHKDYWFSLL